MKQLDTILRGRFPTSFFFGSLRGIIGLVLIVRFGDKHSVGFITLLYCIFDAAFRNPDFYKTQAMRLPIYIKPRIIDCSDETEQYICLPRRFGKSLNLGMLLAYYSKGCESHELFDNLVISKMEGYTEHLNK